MSKPKTKKDNNNKKIIDNAKGVAKSQSDFENNKEIEIKQPPLEINPQNFGGCVHGNTMGCYFCEKEN